MNCQYLNSTYLQKVAETSSPPLPGMSSTFQTYSTLALIILFFSPQGHINSVFIGRLMTSLAARYQKLVFFLSAPSIKKYRAPVIIEATAIALSCCELANRGYDSAKFRTGYHLQDNIFTFFGFKDC